MTGGTHTTYLHALLRLLQHLTRSSSTCPLGHTVARSETAFHHCKAQWFTYVRPRLLGRSADQRDGRRLVPAPAQSNTCYLRQLAAISYFVFDPHFCLLFPRVKVSASGSESEEGILKPRQTSRDYLLRESQLHGTANTGTGDILKLHT